MDYDALKNFMNNAENFNTFNGLHITQVSDGYCECEVELTKWSLNPQGVAHGSLIFTLCDVVTGIAAASGGRSMLTLNASISFLRTGQGKKLRAVSSLVKDGRTVGVFDANVYDEYDRLVAKGEFTVFYTGKHVLLPDDNQDQNTWL